LQNFLKLYFFTSKHPFLYCSANDNRAKEIIDARSVEEKIAKARIEASNKEKEKDKDKDKVEEKGSRKPRWALRRKAKPLNGSGTSS
jgi:hypothetical protein